MKRKNEHLSIHMYRRVATACDAIKPNEQDPESWEVGDNLEPHPVPT